MGEQTVVRIGSKGPTDEELEALEADGRVRRETRVLKCANCDFSEMFDTLFIEQENGEIEEFPSKSRTIIQQFHNLSHPDLRSNKYRVRFEGHPSENREVEAAAEGL